MRPSLDAIAGALALLATLLLASPGVRVTRAADPDENSASAVRAGPVCGAGRTEAPAPEIDAVLERMRLEAIARERSAPGPKAARPVSLNSRGYNYGSPPGVEPARLEAELRRLRK